MVCQRAWGVGVYEALLYKKHKNYGIPKMLMSWKSFIKAPLEFMLEVISFKVRDKDAIAKWMLTLAWRAAHIELKVPNIFARVIKKRLLKNVETQLM